jgi:hypothetical protein
MRRETGVLEEELALLGKEQVEARQVHLLVVGLDLGEVGVDRRVGDHARPHFPFGVEADVGVPRRVERAPGARSLGQADQPVGLHLDVGPRSWEVGEPIQPTGLAHPVESPALARPRRPQRLLVLAADHPPHVEAPAVLTGAEGIAQRAEGDGHLRRPALRPAQRPHGPDGAPVGVERARLVRDERIELRAVRVSGEHEGVAPVAERIEEDRHRVVARELVAAVEAAGLQELVALKKVGHHPLGLRVPRQDADVEVSCVEEHAHLGLLGGRLALERLALAQAGGRRRERPRRLVEAPVDAQLARQADRDHGGLVGRGGEGTAEEEEEVEPAHRGARLGVPRAATVRRRETPAAPRT